MPKGMKLSMTIFCIIALVLVFNFPVVCLGLLMYAGVITTIPNAIGMAFHVLWYIHSSLNPLIFLLTLPDFKEEARKLLKVRHSAAVNPKDSIGNSL
eukprot:sb/3478993/